MLQPVNALCLHLSARGIADKVLSPRVGHRRIDVLQLRKSRRAWVAGLVSQGRSTRPQHGLAMHVGFV